MKTWFPLLLILVACQKSSPYKDLDSSSYVIRNVDIINVKDGSISQGKSVVINEGKITAIADDISGFGNASIIDGSGKYLLPGLAEMHAHIPQGGNFTDEMLFLYLSNGITTIRGMLGHPSHLDLRRQAENNEILSPRIFTSGPSMNGNSVKTWQEAVEKVEAYKEAGYDFLKLHPGIKLDVFDTLVKTANDVGITYAGHVSIFVGVNRAVESKYASIDHVDGFLEGLVPESAGVDPSENGFFGYNFTDLVDMSLMDDLIAKTVENEVWVVPTQSLFDRWFSPEDPEILAQAPEMKYIPKTMLDRWVSSKKNLISNPEYSAEKWQRFNDIRMSLIKALQDNGHGLILGSDAPQVFNIPGFSIHHELKGMIDAGITPLEAIQSGTINPAIFFGMEGEFGEIIEGASADVILLNGNPVENIENLKNPAGVMVRGQWMDREAIDKKLNDIAEKARGM